MMKFVFAFIVLGLTNQLIAQNNVAIVNEKNNIHYNMSNIKTALKSVKNMEYLKAIKYNNISKKIVKVQNLVANYNIKMAKVYSSKSNTTYTVNFNENNSHVSLYIINMVNC